MHERRCGKCESPIDVVDMCEECLPVKPDMVITSQSENTFTRTECSKGHALTDENTMLKKTRGKYYRACKDCDRVNHERYWANKGSETRKKRYAKSKE
jgi:hypothetical protein